MDADQTLTIDIDGWEGPLDLLLALARTQKVDLRELSILALVEQYLAYVERARALRLELAADYLVMAAWLALLKSALLLPKDPEADPDPEVLAARLQLRLQRLDAMRDAGARLMARDRIGRDVFLRGAPEGLKVARRPAWQVDLYELLAAYGRAKARTAPVLHVVSRRPVMTLEQALRRMETMLGRLTGWRSLDHFLPVTRDPDMAASARASSFLAALELAKRGHVELAQEEVFAPLMIRAA